MLLPIDKKLLLNRQARRQLLQAGLRELTETPVDVIAARKLAHWRQSSGAEIYLLSLLTLASRQVSRRYLNDLGLVADIDRLHIAGTSHQLPLLRDAYAACLHSYPREELNSATEAVETEAGRQSRQQLLIDLFVLEALMDNPATKGFQDLFGDTELSSLFDYRSLIDLASKRFNAPQGSVFLGQSLKELLREPASRAPSSLTGQITFIIQHWGPWLPENIVLEMQTACALAGEENRPRLPGPGPSPSPLFGVGDGSEAPAAFTDDRDWMSCSVLLAKSIHVWLDQLSRRYQRTLTTLSDIPDEELSCLANWGFNALWLIGIWERSTASRRIKQLCGNPEAEASAYALHAYRVAGDLGGEAALQDLEERCRRFGIRLACDVVPNHTGIDSEWVEQHPDWFLQTDQPPYPAYRFSGPDLSDSHATSIRIEDGYWDHSDAAVVCEHIDHRSGQRRYIYHGNDGTHMPWNDTAQLNFLMPEVRKAMSDLIVAIAQRFSLIRFDAAMTLARKHFRRLWFPPPGGSAGVPSRSTHAMSDEDFAKAFPVEFWREVVDRINQEAPETLLIAEAFWLMESYFVRNLGMHRVYNSAFMNMLKREENAKYRKIIKDTLAYNPEILKRYVNFMNNPDEATAVEQFDKGDKYFGVATLLATLPGLPMFGHGQFEGYREKYGMEYRRAYWQEEPDTGFIAHHEQQISPLLRMRHLFADVEHFSLYDFVAEPGINENVYAYSNGRPGEKVLVVFNNAPHPARGRLHQASPKANAGEEGAAQPMPPIWKELGLDAAAGAFCRFHDLNGNEYLQSTGQFARGFELKLTGYEHRVFSNFQLLDDTDGRWYKLHQQLQGRGVDCLDRELLRICYQPLWQALAKLFAPARLHVLVGALEPSQHPQPIQSLLAEFSADYSAFASAIAAEQGGTNKKQLLPIDLQELFEVASCWLQALPRQDFPRRLLAEQWYGKGAQPGMGVSLLSWMMLYDLTRRLDFADTGACLEFLSQFGLEFAWQECAATSAQRREVFLAKLLAKVVPNSDQPATEEASFRELCLAPGNRRVLGINSHAGQSWFLKEGMTALAGAVALQASLMQCLESSGTADKTNDASIAETLRQRLARAAAVGYRLDKFLLLG